MREGLVAVTLLATALVGCVDQAPPEHRVSGTFTENATQDQMDELAGQVEDRGGEFVVLQSFPAQFSATGLADAACEEVAAFAANATYVAHVGSCQPVEPSEDPQEPVNNSSA